MIKYRFYRSKNENLKVFNLQILTDESVELGEYTAATDLLEKAFFDAAIEIIENRLFLKKSTGTGKAWMETIEIYESAEGSTIQLVDDQFDSLLLESDDEELLNKVHELLLQTPLNVPKSSIRKYSPSLILASGSEEKHKLTYSVNADYRNREIYLQRAAVAANIFLEDATKVIEKKLHLKRSDKTLDSEHTLALYETTQGATIEIMRDGSGDIKIECFDRYALKDILAHLSDREWRVWR